ncbi:MAG: endolytic transglycosylase MltG [Lachnospiraceae bacterium]|nr:endolytic transglycosylase MltG [Lachnospiraceae bacterium]
MNAKEIVLSVFATVFKVVIAVILIMLVYRWSLLAYEYGQRVFNEPPVSEGAGREISVTVEETASVMEIGELLEKKGLIRDAELFWIQELLSEYRGEISPGTYTLSTAMRMDEMMEIMSQQAEEE